MYFLKELLIFLCTLLVGNSNVLKKLEKIDNDIFFKLSNKINSFQVLKEQKYAPPFKWYEKAGLFESNIRLNFFGNKIFQELRNGKTTAIFDNDMFSTGWIITALLESTLYGKGFNHLDDNRLNLALEAIGGYKDKNNQNFGKTLLRTFWPQIYDKTNDKWHQQPINIRNLLLNIDKIPWDSIEKVLKALKLNEILKYVEEMRKSGENFVKVFCIPPDFDDTYLNLGLGGLLFKLKSSFPDAYQNWITNNTDVEHLVDVTTKYAYKPFDSDLNRNTIDPRTYFYARKFIQQANDENKDISLITTWIQNIDEQRYLRKEDISMPFNINNVDVTVAANSIFGITSASIYNINNFREHLLYNYDLQATYLNSTKFISWAIKSNFSSRPDLAQVYYPSTYNFLWYASRTLFLIENEFKKFSFMLQTSQLEDYFNNFNDLQDILLEAKTYLQEAFENEATNFLINKAIKQQQDKTYFRDFLGLNDSNIFERPEQNDDDALFSTAQAINILISTWTFQRPDTYSLNWKINTPEQVKNLVTTSVNWLQENILGCKYKAHNTFFSGSVKGFTSVPFWYPSNFRQFLNGTSFDPFQISRDDYGEIITGVQGLIDEQTYQNLLQKPSFGYLTPIDFQGYNTKNNIFPFWSSEPYTYAVSLLALSQFNNLD